jgi:hypothetical protein
MRKLKASFRNFANVPNNKTGNVRSTIIVARSRNHSSSGNVTMCFVFIVELHDTINNIKILKASQKYFMAKLSHAKIKRMYVCMYVCLHVNGPTFLFDFQQMWSFPDRFSWKPPMPKFMEIRPVGAALILADRGTDIMKILGASHDYPNAPKNNDISKNTTFITSFSSSFLTLSSPVMPCGVILFICP